MSLLNLADEILLEIVSSNTLESRDVCNIVQSCKRLHSVALPLLYNCIELYSPMYSEFDEGEEDDGLGLTEQTVVDALVRLLDVLHQHPMRRSWIKSANITWYDKQEDVRALIFVLLSQLLALRNLELYQRNAHSPDWATIESSISIVEFLTLNCDLPDLVSLVVEDRFQQYSVHFFTPFKCLRYLKLIGPTNYTFPPECQVQIAEEKPIPTSNIINIELLNVAWIPCFELGSNSNLRKLTWVTSETHFPTGPQAFNRTFKQFEDTLVELYLSYVQMFLCNFGMARDFSGFKCLKALTCHAQYLCAWQRESPSRVSGNYLHYCEDANIAKRLPIGLESLEIIFDLFIKGVEQTMDESLEDYEWSLALANDKPQFVPKLTHLIIYERAFAEQSRDDNLRRADDAQRVPRVYAAPVRETCRSKGINLEVLTLYGTSEYW